MYNILGPFKNYILNELKKVGAATQLYKLPWLEISTVMVPKFEINVKILLKYKG